MDRKARKTRTKANALTSPTAQRVSLVRSGANQTPFLTIKAEGAVFVEKKELEPMITKLKSQGYALVSFAFKGDDWSEDAVNGWLADGGYEGFTVETGEDGVFTVKAEGEAPEGETRTITTDDGVTIVMLKTAEEEPAPVDETPTAVDAGSEVQPVAADKSEDAATDTVMDLIERVKAAGVLPEERIKALSEVTEMADAIRSLRWLAQNINYEIVYGAGDPTVDAARAAVIEDIKAAANNLLGAFATLVQTEVSVVAEQFNAIKHEEVSMTDKTEDGAAEVVAEKTEGEVAVETPAEAEAPAEVEAEAPAEVVAEKVEGEAPADEAPEQIEAPAEVVAEKTEADPMAGAPAWAIALAGQVESVTKSVAELTDKVNTEDRTKSASDERVEGASASVQSLKGADADEPVSGSDTRTKAEQASATRMGELRLRGAIGL